MNIKELAHQAGFNDFPDDENGVWVTDGYWDEELKRFAELVAAAERELCAKLCEELLTEPKLVGWNGFEHYMTQCAQRIRARGDKHE